MHTVRTAGHASSTEAILLQLSFPENGARRDQKMKPTMHWRCFRVFRYAEERKAIRSRFPSCSATGRFRIRNYLEQDHCGATCIRRHLLSTSTSMRITITVTCADCRLSLLKQGTWKDCLPYDARSSQAQATLRSPCAPKSTRGKLPL